MTEYNAAQRKDVRKAEKLQKIEERERQVFVAGLMDSAAGRRWMHDLLAACHVFTTSFAPDPLTMGFKEGERNIGLLLVADIMRSCPDQYVQMMREENERHHARNNPDPTAGDTRDDDGDYRPREWDPSEIILDR